MIRHHRIAINFPRIFVATLLLLFTACKSTARMSRLNDVTAATTSPTASDTNRAAIPSSNAEPAKAVSFGVNSTASNNPVPQPTLPAFYPVSQTTDLKAKESQTAAPQYLESQYLESQHLESQFQESEQQQSDGSLPPTGSIVPLATTAPLGSGVSVTVPLMPDSTTFLQPTTTFRTTNSSNANSQRLLVKNVRVNRGPLKVAVFNSAKNFPNPSSAAEAMVFPAHQTEVEATLFMSGEFAVAVYQDINSDGELNRNKLGVPVEPFAFSNNAMGRRGPPTFEQAVVVAPIGSSSPMNVIITLP